MIENKGIVYGADNFADDPTNQITYNIKLYNHTSQTLSKSKFDGLLIYVHEILPGHLSIASNLSGWSEDISSGSFSSFSSIFWVNSDKEEDYMNQLISNNYHYSYKWNDDNGDKLYKFYYDPDGVSLHNSDKVYMKYFNQRAISDTSELEIHIYSTPEEAGYDGSNNGGDSGGNSGGDSGGTSTSDSDTYNRYPSISPAGWEKYNKGKRAELMYASIIPSCTDACFFLTKYFVFAGVTSDEKELNYIYHEKVYTTKSRRYVFYEIDEATYNTHSNDNDYYRIDSVFGGLNVANCDFDKSTAAINGAVEGSNGNTFLGTTSPPKYIEDNIIKPSLHRLLTVTQEVGDQSGRQPTYNLNYGRVRPLGNPEDGKSNRKNDVVGSPFNGFSNNTLRARYAQKCNPNDTDYQYGGVHYNFISNLGSDELHGDGPTSWPSGHSSQCWAMAMAVVQLYGLKYNNTSDGIQQGKIISTICKYVHKAYKFGVLRTVGRFHWNSDTMYGKIFGSLVMPILNASVDISNSGAQYYNELFDAAVAELFPGETLTRIDSIPTIDLTEITSIDPYDSWFPDFKELINKIGSDTNIGVPTLNDQNIGESIFGYLWYMYKAGRTEVESNSPGKVFDFFNDNNTQFYPYNDDNYYFDDNNDDIIENWDNYRSWFPEVFPKNHPQKLTLLQGGSETTITYHGNNSSYYKNGDYRANISGLTRSKILCSWLMAFCLSELYVSKADKGDTSIQTKIFNSAYNIGGGRELNFYDEYNTGYDPVYLRLAAGIIYCFNRGKFDSNVIHSLGNNIDLQLDTNSDNTIEKTEADHIIVRREEDDVTDINKKLRLKSEQGLWAQATVDYVVDNYFIFPNAPGPYTPGRQMSKPFEKGQYKVGDNSKIQGETQFIIPGVKIVNPNNEGGGGSSTTELVYSGYDLSSPLIEQDLLLTGSSLGNYKYSVGLLSDIHSNVDNNTSTNSSDWWYDEDDLIKALKIFTSEYKQKVNHDISFICACGDVTEAYCTNLGWPEADAENFKNVYTANAKGLPFYSSLGNHDFMGLYNAREGDSIQSDINTDLNATTTNGYNSGVSSRIQSIWFNNVQSESIITSQNEIHYFEYHNNMSNNYSKLNYWFEKDGDIYIIMSVDYGNDIWGPTGNNESDWKNRMICPRNSSILNNKINNHDPYMDIISEYVSTGTEYPSSDKSYNYQFYHPEVLVWLKDLIEKEENKNKKIFVFSHHFLPNKVGCTIRPVPREKVNGYYPWVYGSIYPDTYGENEENNTQEKEDRDSLLAQAKIDRSNPNVDLYRYGSGRLCGIEFFFINKLNNEHKNVVFFSGHSHLTWANMNDSDTEGISDITSNKFKTAHIDNHDYRIYVNKDDFYRTYTRNDSTANGGSGYWVALPSLSKPTNAKYNPSTDLDKNTLRPSADITIMDVYENGVKIKGWSMLREEKTTNDEGSTSSDDMDTKLKAVYREVKALVNAGNKNLTSTPSESNPVTVYSDFGNEIDRTSLEYYGGMPGNEKYVTFKITNSSNYRLAWNGKFTFFVLTDNTYVAQNNSHSKMQYYDTDLDGHKVQVYGGITANYYNPYSHQYYSKFTNTIIEKNETIEVKVPLSMRQTNVLGQGTSFNTAYSLENKFLFVFESLRHIDNNGIESESFNTFRLGYSRTKNDDDLLHNSQQSVIPAWKIASSTGSYQLIPGTIFTVTLTDENTKGDAEYISLTDSFNKNVNKACIAYRSSNGYNVYLPMNLDDWSN